MSTEVGGLSYIRQVASITWGLEKHSSYILVNEQPAIRVQEDLILTCGQLKLTRYGMYDSYLTPSDMLGLHF
jgi:hypothetical protein